MALGAADMIRADLLLAEKLASKELPGVSGSPDEPSETLRGAARAFQKQLMEKVQAHYASRGEAAPVNVGRFASTAPPTGSGASGARLEALARFNIQDSDDLG